MIDKSSVAPYLLRLEGFDGHKAYEWWSNKYYPESEKKEEENSVWLYKSSFKVIKEKPGLYFSDISMKMPDVFLNNILNNIQPETKCSGGNKTMSIITNAFKSKENKALEALNLGSTESLNDEGRKEFVNYIFETNDTSKKGFLAKVVEIYKESKK